MCEYLNGSNEEDGIVIDHHQYISVANCNIMSLAVCFHRFLSAHIGIKSLNIRTSLSK